MSTHADNVERKSEEVLRIADPYEEALLNLMRTADHLQRDFQHRLKPYGLTGPQYNVLRILRGARPAGLTCSAIGHSMITAVPDTTRLLARLTAQKLVRQERDTHDRRILWNHISKQGLDMLAQLDAIVKKAPAELFAQLNLGEVKELTKLLKQTQCCREVGCEGNTVSSEKAALPSGKPPLPQSPLLRRLPE